MGHVMVRLCARLCILTSVINKQSGAIKVLHNLHHQPLNWYAVEDSPHHITVWNNLILNKIVVYRTVGFVTMHSCIHIF